MAWTNLAEDLAEEFSDVRFERSSFHFVRQSRDDTRATRIESHECDRCGAPLTKARLGKRACVVCAHLEAKSSFADKTKRVSEGRCKNCGQDKSTKRKTPLCDFCYDKQRAMNSNAMRRKAASGKCSDCGAPTVGGATACHTHQAIRRARFRAYYYAKKASRQANLTVGALAASAV